GVIERHRAERLEALVLRVIFHELDTDFGDDHVCSPVDGGTLKSNHGPRRPGPATRPPVHRAGPEPFAERRRRHGRGRTPCCRFHALPPRGEPILSTAPASAPPPGTASPPAPASGCAGACPAPPRRPPRRPGARGRHRPRRRRASGL